MVDAYIMRAIIAIFILAINAAIAGSFTIFKDITFLVAGAAHAALAGASLAIAISLYTSLYIDPMLGALIFSIMIALMAANARKANVAVAIGFAASMSLAVLFISLIREQASRVWGLLFGDLLLLTLHDIIVMAIATIFILMLVIYFSREFLFISFDSEGAMASGINVKALNYLLLSIIAVSTVIIMKGVGAILVYAMLVAPAAASNEMAKSIMQVFSYAALIALLAGFSGLVISFYFNISPGAIASLIATLIYFVVIMKRR
ncbi:MAG: metal ABC transporter permease [Thermoplasmata archaeon]|nr:MAG: metal ABC transporter permease [Thermoplasmata archaeon]MCD6573045.1 metal ABC transporter permease [Thermoplasmata archaeon]